MIWMIIMIAGFLVIGTVMIGFAVQFTFTGPAKVSSELCYSSLQMQYEAQETARKAKNAAKDEANVGYGNDDAGWDDVTEVTTYGGQHMAELAVRDGIDEIGNGIINGIPSMCSQTITHCVGDAKQVSLCLYERAAETFYGLRGGKDRSLRVDKETGGPFYMFKIYVNISEPGSVSFFNETELDVPCPTEYSQEGFEITAVGTGATAECTVTFDTVDKGTMALAMMEVCLREPDGPFSPYCRCFANAIAGYSPKNGIPNSYGEYNPVNNVERAKVLFAQNVKYPFVPSHKGCGWKPSPPPAIEGVEMSNDMIYWDGEYPSVEKSGVYYIALSKEYGDLGEDDIGVIIVHEDKLR